MFRAQIDVAAVKRHNVSVIEDNILSLQEERTDLIHQRAHVIRTVEPPLRGIELARIDAELATLNFQIRANMVRLRFASRMSR